MKFNSETLKELLTLKKEGKPNSHLAAHFHVHPQTIVYWTARLRKAGHDIPKHKGSRSTIDLVNL